MNKFKINLMIALIFILPLSQALEVSIIPKQPITPLQENYFDINYNMNTLHATDTNGNTINFIEGEIIHYKIITCTGFDCNTMKTNTTIYLLGKKHTDTISIYLKSNQASIAFATKKHTDNTWNLIKIKQFYYQPPDLNFFQAITLAKQQKPFPIQLIIGAILFLFSLLFLFWKKWWSIPLLLFSLGLIVWGLFI